MNVFEAVRDSLTTREVAEYVGLHVKHNGMCCCPFHGEKNPSMKVDKRYHCFACGEDGDEDDDDNSADPLLVSDEEYTEVPVPVQKKRGRPKKSAKNLQSENDDFDGSDDSSTFGSAKTAENKDSVASTNQKMDSSSGSEDILDQLLKDPEIKKKLLAKLLSDVL